MSDLQFAECDGRHALAVTGVLYKVNGFSQPSIVKGSDGRLYVLKCNGFPGPDGLANEVIGAELIRHFGLPAPAWTPIYLSDEFIDANPEIWFRTGTTVIRPAAGLHFGSRLLIGDGPNDRSYQVIPRSWWKRVVNRRDFLGMLVLDLWANNCDRRQAVFIRSVKTQKLRAVFIDNDHLLGGRWGNETTSPRRVMCPDLSAYVGLPLEREAERFIGLSHSVDDRWIDGMLERVPADWATAAMKKAKRAQLIQSRWRLDRLVWDALSLLKTGYSVAAHAAVSATRPAYLMR